MQHLCNILLDKIPKPYLFLLLRVYELWNPKYLFHVGFQRDCAPQKIEVIR